jgi:acetylglutamate kinase
VHGGGDEISALQRRLGTEPTFVGGRRVTSVDDVEVLRMALSGSANKRLVGALVAAGALAVGVSGEDGAMIDARLEPTGTLGRVGVPAAVDAGLLRALLGAGYLPVVSPVSRDAGAGDGSALNVNGDDAAAAIAASLGARELLLVSDVPGVLSGGRTLDSIDAVEARALIGAGVAQGGMAAKLEAAIAALAAGVARVRIGDIASISDSTRGTTVVSLPPASTLQDVA